MVTPIPVEQFEQINKDYFFFPEDARAAETPRFDEFSLLGSVLALVPTSAAAGHSITLMRTPKSLQTPAGSQK